MPSLSFQKKAARLLLDLTDDQSNLVIRIILCFKRLVEDLSDELLTSTIKEFGLYAIDVNNLNSVLAIQAVGSYLIFYLTQFKSDGLYLMVELDHLRFPLSLNELPRLIEYVDRLYDILNVFEQFCILTAVKERPSSKKGKQ
ncbi:hypothetical protein AB4K20DRAFT_1981587 [Rhizopus microsporus]